MINQKPFRGRIIKTKEHRTNKEIDHAVVRITGTDIESKVVPISEALAISQERGVDLIEIVSTTNPPVCLIADYSKYLYEQKKKKNNVGKQSVTKEILMTPNIGQHDIDFKVKHAIEFLGRGDKVKLKVKFTGRENQFAKQGEILLLKFSQFVIDVGKAENLPVKEGKFMYMTIVPKKK